MKTHAQATIDDFRARITATREQTESVERSIQIALSCPPPSADDDTIDLGDDEHDEREEYRS